MVNVTVELYGISDVAAVVKTVQHRVMNLRPAWFGIRDVILQGTRERFNKQGELDGVPWEPLHPLTVFMRGQRGSSWSGILSETGKLKSIFNPGNSANLGFQNYRTMMKLTVRDTLAKNGGSLAAIQQWSSSPNPGYRKQRITKPMRWYLSSMGVKMPKDKKYLNHPNRRFFMIEGKDSARIGMSLLNYLVMGVTPVQKTFVISGMIGGHKFITGMNLQANQRFSYWKKIEKARYAMVEGKRVKI